MCRNIKPLRRPDRRPTDEEIDAAALQYVRKVSGYRVPAKVNQAAFDAAVAEIAEATRRLMDNLVARGQPTAPQSAISALESQ